MNLKTIGEFEGTPVYEAVLKSAAGSEIVIISYGASVRDWRVSVDGKIRHVVLGYPDFEPYRRDESYLGAIIGRVANRIGGARFTLNGKTYSVESEGKPYQLHGGPKGIGRRNWSMDFDGKAVTLKRFSPAGEMGFPGDASFTVTYRLEGEKLNIVMQASVSEPTPVSLVQHGYFNLMGEGTALDHFLKINAKQFTPLDQNLVPTGELRPVQGTIYDLNEGRTLRDAQGKPLDYDINLVLNPARDFSQPVAELTSPDKKLKMELWTDQPGMQVYNSVHLDHRAVCLEDQMFPDAMNRPEFPSILVTPENPYRHECAIRIACV